MLDILKHSHSGLRWIILIMLIVAIFNALAKKNSGSYTAADKKINLFAMIFLHVQLLIGLIMYFVSPYSPVVHEVEGWMSSTLYRFYGLEHFLGMVIAIVLVTIGRKKAEKEAIINKKHAKIAMWYTIGLLIILATIPWPFRNLGVTSWF